MTATEHNYVSAIFTNLIDPLVTLHEAMVRLGSEGPNEVQAAPTENGYAVAMVALAAFMIEGVCSRARYVTGTEDRRRTPIDTLHELGAPDLAENVEEVFVVRDAVAHSHLWTATVSHDRKGLQFQADPERLPFYGDKKFDRVVDPSTRKTRRLGLDVFPPRVCRHTAVLALKEAVAVFRFLESQDRRFAYLEPVHVFVAGEYIPLYQWVDSLST